MTLIPALAVFLLQTIASPQAPPAPKASIEGVVLRTGTDAPIMGAQVTLTVAPGPGAGPRPTIDPVTTDRTGKFSFKDLEARSYRLAVVNNGDAREEFGQRQVGGTGTPIVLAASQALENIAIRLTPAGNVSGHVRSSNGRPAPGVTVHLARSNYNANGVRLVETLFTTRSDDRGEYRLYWVTPGRYYVIAGSPSLGFGFGGSEDNDNVVVPRFPYSFFPGTAEFEKAMAIDVKPGAEVDAIDFALVRVGEYRIRGRVVDPVSGQAPPKATASISYWNPRGGGAASGGDTYNLQTGTVDFGPLTPGLYEISVSAYDGPGIPASSFNRGGPGPSAGLTVVVGNSDVDIGTLRLEPPHAITGSITGDLPPENAAANTQISFWHLETPGVSSPSPFRAIDAFPRADWSLTASFPYPSTRVTVSNLPVGFYVREARLNGVDALANPAPVSSSNTLEIVLSSKGGQVEGVIRNQQGQAAGGSLAVLVPDTARSRPELFKQAVADQNGRFSINSISPGGYKLFAWDGLAPYSYFDPDVLRKYEQRGQPISIEESARRVQDLNVIPAGVE